VHDLSSADQDLSRDEVRERRGPGSAPYRLFILSDQVRGLIIDALFRV